MQGPKLLARETEHVSILHKQCKNWPLASLEFCRVKSGGKMLKTLIGYHHSSGFNIADRISHLVRSRSYILRNKTNSPYLFAPGICRSVFCSTTSMHFFLISKIHSSLCRGFVLVVLDASNSILSLEFVFCGIFSLTVCLRALRGPGLI